jgi:hypothetical protein
MPAGRFTAGRAVHTFAKFRKSNHLQWLHNRWWHNRKGRSGIY